MRKGVQENRGSSKNVIFRLKIVYLAFGFNTCREFADSKTPGGHFVPPRAPLIAVTASRNQ